MTVVPGQKGTAGLEEVPDPDMQDGALLVRGMAVGVCGTDHEIAEGAYGTPPSGEARLVIGHESLGEVLEAPPGSGFAPGDLVVGIVRLPDPMPCPRVPPESGTCAGPTASASAALSGFTGTEADTGGWSRTSPCPSSPGWASSASCSNRTHGRRGGRDLGRPVERQRCPPVRARWIASGQRAASGPATDLMRVRRPRPGHTVRHLRADGPGRRRARPPAARRQGIRDRWTRRPWPSVHAIPGPRPLDTFVSELR